MRRTNIKSVAALSLAAVALLFACGSPGRAQPVTLASLLLQSSDVPAGWLSCTGITYPNGNSVYGVTAEELLTNRWSPTACSGADADPAHAPTMRSQAFRFASPAAAVRLEESFRSTNPPWVDGTVWGLRSQSMASQVPGHQIWDVVMTHDRYVVLLRTVGVGNQAAEHAALSLDARLMRA